MSSNPSLGQRPSAAPKRSRALALPMVGNVAAIGRYFRDRDASLWGKLFVVSAVVYLVWPVDLVPDVMPFLGWLDDIGFVALALGYLSHVLRDYQDAK